MPESTPSEQRPWPRNFFGSGLAQVKRLVGKGGYRSLRACVNEALRLLLDRERHARLERAVEKASRDEMFLADIQGTMEDFKYFDAETARTIEKG
jgi:Arc/MetJ-type ribon-helix-helix transcriptional regulator